MYFESLCAHPSLLAQSRLSQDLVKKQPPRHSFGSHSKGGTSKTGSHGSNPAWFSLSPHAHETAQAYSLGLLFYCIFKCVSNVRVILANASPYEPNVEFPEFKRTPDIMRDCIRRCTIDAPECELENERITKRGLEYRGFENVVRIDGKLYPQGYANEDRDPESTAEAVLEAAKAWRESELKRAENCFASDNWQTGQTGRERPTLREV